VDEHLPSQPLSEVLVWPTGKPKQIPLCDLLSICCAVSYWQQTAGLLQIHNESNKWNLGLLKSRKLFYVEPGPASHWPFITDPVVHCTFLGLHRLNSLRKGHEHPAYTPAWGMATLIFLSTVVFQGFSRVISGRWFCLCPSVCPRSKRKTAWSTNTKVGRHNGRASKCIDPEIKGQRLGSQDCQVRCRLYIFF